MKHKFLLAAMLFLTMVFVAHVSATDIVVISDKPSPAPEDYEEIISAFKDMRAKVFDIEALKDFKLKNKVTGEEKKFSELSTLEQNTFMLVVAERFSKAGSALQKAWDAELKVFADPKHKLIPRPKIENQKQNPAQKADVEVYCKQLLEVRKQFAVEYEKFAEKFFEDNKADITEKEKNHALGQIRKFHDDNKLIERKKKE